MSNDPYREPPEQPREHPRLSGREELRREVTGFVVFVLPVSLLLWYFTDWRSAAFLIVFSIVGALFGRMGSG